MSKRVYKIPVIYEMYGTYEIEAESLEEAARIAIEERPLPEDGEFISESMFVDSEGVWIHNDDMNKEDMKYVDVLQENEPTKFG